MNDSPLLSIITPVYNGEIYIRETIESVLNSDIRVNYEYIIINDGSTDSTLNIISSYSKSIQIMSQNNAGESSAVNAGLKNAKGDFALVLSADDPLLTGDLITRALEIFAKNQTVIAVYPDWQMIDDSGQVVKVVTLPDYSDELMIGRNWCLPGPGVIFKKDLAIQIGGRNESLRFTGDFDFWLRLSTVGKIERMPGVFAQWRRSQHSTSISQRGYSMALERIRVVEDFIETYPIEKQLSRKSLASAYVMASKLTFFDPSIPGRKMLIKAFRLRRGWPELASLQILGYVFLVPYSGYLVRFVAKVLRRI
jgi:glycosyltransferase involved in cell wall biosynthesis